MFLVILESPYAGEVGRNILYAKRCVRDCLGRGEAPIASHLLFTQPGILDDKKAEERAKGITAGHSWIRRADRVVAYLDYGISGGMSRGMEVARACGIPVEYRSIGTNDGEDTSILVDFLKATRNA